MENKFNKLVEGILNERHIKDYEADIIALILTGKTGLDSMAPIKEYYDEIRKRVSSLKKLSDKDIRKVIDDVEKKYPEKFKSIKESLISEKIDTYIPFIREEFDILNRLNVKGTMMINDEMDEVEWEMTPSSAFDPDYSFILQKVDQSKGDKFAFSYRLTKLYFEEGSNTPITADGWDSKKVDNDTFEKELHKILKNIK